MRRVREPLRQAILILGMHRSGTSALGGALHALGVTAPKTLLDASAVNPRGFWESMPLIAEGERLLAAAGSSWDDWRRLDSDWFNSSAAEECRRSIKKTLQAEYGDAAFIFIKEPRICRFVPIYLSVLQDLGIKPIALLPLRNPLEVAQSLKRRDGFAASKSLLLWLRHVLDAEHFTRTVPRCIFFYDEFLTDWRRELRRAAALTSVTWPADLDQAGAAVDAFLTADLHRERVSWDDAKQNRDVTILVRETFEVLRTLTTESRAGEHLGELDRLRAKFDEGCELFGPAIAAEELASQQAGAELARKAGDMEAELAAIRSGHDHDISSVRAALATEAAEKQQLIDAQSSAAREIGELRKAAELHLKEKEMLASAVSAAADECNALRAASAEQAKEVKRLAGSVSEMEGERREQAEMVQHLRTAVTQREQALNHLTEQAEELRSVVAQTQNQINIQLALRDSMLNSTSWRLTAPLRHLKKLFTW